jgi:hypothetical protein
MRLNERMVEGLAKLCDDDSLWRIGKDGSLPTRDVRRSLIITYVATPDDKAGNKIAGRLQTSTRNKVFGKLNALRGLDAERIQLETEIAKSSAPDVEAEVGALVAAPVEAITSVVAQAETPVAPEVTALQRVEPVGRQEAPRARRLANKSPDKTVHEGELIHLSAEEERARGADHLPNWDDQSISPDVRAVLAAARQRDQQRASLVAGERAAAAVDTQVVPSTPRIESTHAAELVGKYEIPGKIPEAVGQWTALFDQVQAIVSTGVYHVDGMSEARNKLDTALMILDAEADRIRNIFEEGRIQKLDKERLEAYVRDGRRRRQQLLRRIRPALKEGLVEPAETPTPASREAGAELSAEQVIREQLGLVRADLLQGHRLLGAEVLDATAVNELMGDIETRISQISKTIEDERTAGRSVGVLDALEQASRKDLRRLQEQAKRAISELTKADLLPDYQPEDLHELIDETTTLETNEKGQIEKEYTRGSEPRPERE